MPGRQGLTRPSPPRENSDWCHVLTHNCLVRKQTCNWARFVSGAHEVMATPGWYRSITVLGGVKIRV